MSVGRRIKRSRLAKGFSQRELAEPRYTASYLCIIEQGKRNPSPAALSYFAGELEVGEEELLTGRPPDLPQRLETTVREARLKISHGQIAEALEALEKVVRDARRYDLVRHEATAIEYIGRCHEHNGDLERAIAKYDEAIDRLADEPPTARASAVAAKARCVNLRGDKHYSIHLLESALGELARERLLDPHALVTLHSAAVLPYFEAGLPRRAKDHADEALRLSAKLTDPALIAAMHLQVARVLLDDGHIADADASLRRAEEGFRQIDMQSEMAMAQLARGYAYLREGRVEEAREQLTAALTVFEAVGRPIDEARVLNELARLDRESGNPDAAQGMLKRAIRLLDDRDVAELALAHREMALSIRGIDSGKAEKHLRTSIELFELAEDRIEMALTYAELGDLLEEQSPGSGRDYYREGLSALV